MGFQRCEPWAEWEQNLTQEEVDAYLADETTSIYSIVKRLQDLMPYRSWESIRSKFRRYMR